MFYGKRLKELRIEKGMTQQALANLCNLDKASICCYEKGTRTPTLETFKHLLDVLEVDANYLLGTERTIIAEDGTDRYYANMAVEDFEILKAIKSNPELYKFLIEDPKRGIKYLNNKL